MKIVQSYLKKNPCYTAGKKITVKGLMLHSVGCPQPKASAFINSWNKESFDNACVHAFIDGNNGTVYQTLPWNHRGWHCGKGVFTIVEESYGLGSQKGWGKLKSGKGWIALDYAERI